MHLVEIIMMPQYQYRLRLPDLNFAGTEGCTTSSNLKRASWFLRKDAKSLERGNVPPSTTWRWGRFRMMSGWYPSFRRVCALINPRVAAYPPSRLWRQTSHKENSSQTLNQGRRQGILEECSRLKGTRRHLGSATWLPPMRNRQPKHWFMFY